MRIRSVWSVATGVAMCCSLAKAQPQQTHKLLAADGGFSEYFGHAVSASGDLAVVGAFNSGGSGASYVYSLTTGAQLHKLKAADNGAGDHFGYALATSGPLGLVGALGDDDKGLQSGSAYVFDLVGGQEIRKVLATDGAKSDEFGFACALQGNLGLVSATGDDDLGDSSGSAYIFDVMTGQQLHKLTASDGAAYDFFGRAVAISDTVAVVGAYEDDDRGAESGSAYVFDIATGQELLKLTSSDGAAGDRFGESLAISGNVLLVGASWADANGVDSGAAYVFDVVTGLELRKLTAEDGMIGDRFGYSLALGEGRAFVGAMQDDDNGVQSGSVYVFDLVTGKLRAKFSPQDGGVGDLFGISLALGSGNRAVVGAVNDDDLGSDAGSAYIVDMTEYFEPYGSGCPGTGRIAPRLDMSGFATPGGTVQLGIFDGVGSGTALLLLGLQEASIPMTHGCLLNVAPVLPVTVGPLPLFPFGAQGAGAGSITIPVVLPPTVAAPASMTLQAFVVDPGAAGGFANTNGLVISVKP